MGKLRLSLLLAITALIAGCGTFRAVRDARLEQETWVDRGTGKEAELPVEQVRLVGWKLPQLVDFAMANRPAMARARLAVEDARLALREVAADAPLLSSTPWNSPKVNASIGRSEMSEPGHKLHGDTDGSASGARTGHGGRAAGGLGAEAERKAALKETGGGRKGRGRGCR